LGEKQRKKIIKGVAAHRGEEKEKNRDEKQRNRGTRGIVTKNGKNGPPSLGKKEQEGEKVANAAQTSNQAAKAVCGGGCRKKKKKKKVVIKNKTEAKERNI